MNDVAKTAAGKQLIAHIEQLEGPEKGESWEAYRKAIRALVVSGVTLAEQQAHEQGCQDCHD